MSFGADDNRARMVMNCELTMRMHGVHFAMCATKDDVVQYVIKCGHDIGYVPPIMLDAAFYAATWLMWHGKPGQHIIDGVYGEHG